MRMFIIIALAFCAIGFGSCENSTTQSASNSNGNGNNSGHSGSLARFAIADHYLYTVDKTTLRLFDLEGRNAKFINEIPVGFNIETIFVRENTLFLGSSNGVHIYDISTRTAPQHLSTYQHIVSCDPVVADAFYAYSTLSTGRPNCMRGANLLDIIDISDLTHPNRVFSVPLSNPGGLGLLGNNRLVVCDNGIKLLDITNPRQPVLLQTVTTERPFDIIPFKERFVAVVPGGLTNFAVQNDSLQLMGKLVYK